MAFSDTLMSFLRSFGVGKTPVSATTPRRFANGWAADTNTEDTFLVLKRDALKNGVTHNGGATAVSDGRPRAVVNHKTKSVTVLPDGAPVSPS